MATQGENPVLLLSGDSPVAQDGRGAFQELDQVAVASTLTKFSRRLTDASRVADDVVDALVAAHHGRPGPSHLALAFDVLNAEVTGATAPDAATITSRLATPPVDAADIEAVLTHLASASRPVILTGPTLNRTRAGTLTERMRQVLDVPVIAMESPRGLNDPSLGAFSRELANADYVLSLGKRIDFTTGFGGVLGSPDARVDVVDPDSEEIERARQALGNRLQLTAEAPAARFAKALLTGAGAGEATKGKTSRQPWHEAMRTAAETRPDAPPSGRSPMSPVELCEAVQRLLDKWEDPILVIDGGEFGQWAQASLNVRRRMINGPSGAIGGCLCYAIAASIAEPNTPVVVLMGDGTVGFHFAEFETAHRYGANIISVIGHDAKWNAEVQIQLREYGAQRLIGCELNETRYDLAAAGFGCHPEFVTETADLDDALDRAADSGLPACVTVQMEGLAAPAGSGH